MVGPVLLKDVLERRLREWSADPSARIREDGKAVFGSGAEEREMTRDEIKAHGEWLAEECPDRN